MIMIVDFFFYFVQGSGVTVYSLHPGVIRTELGRHLFSTLPRWKRIIAMPIMMLIKTPWEGAQTTIHCAVDENLANESGFYYRLVFLTQMYFWSYHMC